MKVLSVNVSQPKTIEWKGNSIITSIFKEPVEGDVSVNKLGLSGDSQSDLRVHGGIHKAVYAYPQEHYEYWKKEYGELEFSSGMFGENLTITGLLENEVFLGDELEIGTARLKVVQPRFPCNKLAAKFEDPLMVRKFLESRFSGFYFEVIQEGHLKAGDEIMVTKSTGLNSITKFVELYATKEPTEESVSQLLEDPNLIEEWKDFFRNKIKVHDF